jgi:hypothetical protein
VFRLLVLFGGAFVFVLLVIRDHYLRAEGEPFSLVAGVSIWPGEALRLIAAILSVCFIVKSLRVLENNEEELCKEFKLHELKITKWRKMKKRLKRWRKRRGGLCSIWQWVNIRGWKNNKREVYAQRLWKRYLVRGICRNRFCRLVPRVLVFTCLAATVILILGVPNIPHRGNVSWVVDRVLLLFSVYCMIFLVFFVLDVTTLSLRLIHNLKGPRTIWPKGLVRRLECKRSKEGNSRVDWATKLAKGSEDDSSEESYGLSEWLDIKFIASHTQAVGKLIYYPFIILLVMIVARNRYFDNWNFPISLTIVFLLYFVHAIGCGIMLRLEAEKARSMALDRLGKELVEATGDGDKRRTKQLEVMIEQVKSIREGAYSPFTENPILRAILIPSGGISLLTLLRFLPLS